MRAKANKGSQIVVRRMPLRDTFSTVEGAQPACRAEPIDEYRDLAMLARAWESGSLELNGVEEALSRADEAKGKESALR